MRFMDRNFLLKSKTAETLFFNHADKMPIFDFHCHLSPKAIYENKNFKNITEAWLGGDHYKWRAMRSFGVEEKWITGDGDDYEKFLAFVRTLEYAPGNPLYHWAHLELQRYFDITDPLTEKNAKDIYEKVNAKLARDDFRVRELIVRSSVRILYTTDDPTDTLEYHAKIKNDESFPVRVAPAFRPDKAVNIELNGFADYIGTLSQASGVKISCLDSLKEALRGRIDVFEKAGCRASDHGITMVPYVEAEEGQVNGIFRKALNREVLTALEAEMYKTHMLQYLAGEYAARKWVMEIHVGVLRNNNTKMFEKLGPDTGYDSVGDYPVAEKLARLLNAMEEKGSLPKTVLFSANARDNLVLSTILGCFQNSEAASKIQSGTAWWFNDHIDGMLDQMKILGNVGLLGKFIGMLTDSRSFLSYPRHEYFRRILCNLIGGWIDNGEYYADEEFAGKLIEGICYGNAVAYFGETV